MKTYWQYFNMVFLPDWELYKLVDEQGIDLTEDGGLVLFASAAKAEVYLEDLDIRGSVR